MQNSFEINKKIGKGINLGNALEAPHEGDWELVIKSEYFKLIKENGFNSVRIPIRWDTHITNSISSTIDENFFKRVDFVVQKALDNNLLVVINVHHFIKLYSSPKKYKESFYTIWKQISDRYCSYSENLIFEILNEPRYKLTSRKWNKIIPITIDIIRKKNPERIILFGPAKWNNIEGLKKLNLPEDIKNFIITFHYYKPFTFTHQGAYWIIFSNFFLGKKWNAGKMQKAKINNHFKKVFDWGEKNNVPINLGEFGAYQKADLHSRILWTTEVVKTAKKYDFSWFYWEFGAGFGVYDINKKKWNRELLNSLIQ